jgi:hypothetical protein
MRLYGMVLNQLNTGTPLLERWEEVDIIHGKFRLHVLTCMTSRWLPSAAARFEPGSGHVGFVVDKVELG